MTVTSFRRTARTENSLHNEGLKGRQSSGDRARSIWVNVLCIIKDKKALANEEAQVTPNPKMVAKYKDIIANCTRSIKENMVQIGANEEHIEKMMEFIEGNNTEGVEGLLLDLLMKRNPGLYRGKLALFKNDVKQK